MNPSSQATQRPDPSRFLPFPPVWSETLPEARVSEAFGLVPLFFGLGFIGFGASMLSLQWYRPVSQMHDLPLIGGVLLVGLACLAYEGYRRVRRTRLLVQGERIALYRGSAFSEEIQRTQVIRFQLNHGNTFKMACGPLVIGGMLLYLALEPTDTSLRPTLVALGGPLLGLAVSTLVTRLALRTYLVPRGSKHEEILLTKRGVDRLGLEG